MSKREQWERRINGTKALIGSAPYELLLNSIIGALDFLFETYMGSVPPDGKKRVTNFYVEMVEGSPKLRVEYEE